jgi:hypothetical protein
MLNSTLVILMISPNYYESVFCLGELGAAWATELNIFPLLNQMEFSQIGALLTGVQLRKITEPSHLDSLRDTLVRLFEVPEPKTATWNAKRDLFLNAVPDILEHLPKPKTIDAKTHQELQDIYHALLEEVASRDKEITSRDQLIEQLKNTKDREEVRNIILENSDEKEQFERLVDDAKTALGYLPSIVQRMLYYDYVGDNFILRNNSWEGINDLDQATEARQSGYLTEPTDIFGVRASDGTFELNANHRRVTNAQTAVRKLSEFIRNLDNDSEVVQWFYEENDYPIDECMQNIEFWRSHLF